MPSPGLVEKVKDALWWQGKGIPLTAEQLGATSSTLTNPQNRVEIPADFPRLLLLTDRDQIIKALDRELREKHNTTLAGAGRINIVYPHKHPLKFPRHQNNAEKYAREAWYALEGGARQVEWVLGSSLVELVRLDRSEIRTSVHALAGKQEYVLYEGAQDSPPMKFGKPGHDKKEYFLIVDSGFDQGTTLANLMSYITANGGTVLAAAVPSPDAGLLQQQDTSGNGELLLETSLRPEFLDASRNTGRLPQMAKAFADSARKSGKDWTPQQALDLFEEKLNKVGNSVFALTDGEAARVIESVSEELYLFYAPFTEMLEQLDKKAAAPLDKKSTVPMGMRP